ncbi:MAG: hypothetical protein JWO87_3287 [Phycisphaerales bacterium]|nr:hypothetical protein [Phycisphaerales bacterium]
MDIAEPDLPAGTGVRNPIATLRRLARPKPVEERCELCSAALAQEHQHLLQPANRQLFCACDACAVLFGNGQTGQYRRVPRRIEHWPDFQIGDVQWDSLGIPITLAFFFHSTPAQQVMAMYPSPAGATETMLAADVWQLLVDDNLALAELEPDVEALLVNRVGGARDYYRAPIDECFKLVGLIRTHWRGLHGGNEAWAQIGRFFESLKARSVKPRKHA